MFTEILFENLLKTHKLFNNVSPFLHSSLKLILDFCSLMIMSEVLSDTFIAEKLLVVFLTLTNITVVDLDSSAARAQYIVTRCPLI